MFSAFYQEAEKEIKNKNNFLGLLEKLRWRIKTIN
jgi:uncharacterized protein YhbP (UPF0306 family)